MAQLKVFVSHSHEDDAFCRELVQALRQAGADVWYDEHNMGSGRLGPTIERELRARPIFVVILSPAALRSQWVEDEVRWAYTLLRKDSTRMILPVTAATIQEDNIWLFLQDFKRVESFGLQPYPTAEAIQRTLSTLTLKMLWNPPRTDSRESQGILPSSAEDTAELPLWKQVAIAQELVSEGVELQASGEHGKALRKFKIAARLVPESMKPWRPMAISLRALGRTDEAEQAEQRARELGA